MSNRIGSGIDYFSAPLAITDVETTGLDVRRHEIIEIGLVVVHQKTFEITDTLDVKVIPTHIETAAPDSSIVAGYRPDHWTGAITLENAMAQYAAKTKGMIFTAHNVSFDWQFIEEAFRLTKLSHGLDYHQIDIPSIAWALLKKPKPRMRLSALCDYFGIEREPSPHRGINGAMKAYEVLKKLVGLLPSERVIQ
ncbi:MAG: 3'-5' exonuclease [Patescibacteria group bacterium]